MTRTLREKMVEELARTLEGLPNLVLVDYRKMTASQSVEFRTEMRRGEMGMEVLKNSVAKLALQKVGRKDLADMLTEMSAVVYGPDPVLLAKIVHAFREKNQVPGVRGGVVDGRAVGPEQVAALSKLPGRKEILGQFVGTLAAPMSSFVRVINAIPAGFVQVLAAIRDKQEKAG